MADAKMDKEKRLEIGRKRRAKTRANIIGAAFELFGEEAGLYTRIEDIATRAGITRATFYSHFSGLGELREALTYELTHDFLLAVTYTAFLLEDPRERASSAIRFYLRRVLTDQSWGRSMIHLSANGTVFGAETYRQAELTIQHGMQSGVLTISDSAVGRDLVLGTTLAAMATMVNGNCSEDYPELVAASILEGLGVAHERARAIAFRPLPELQADPSTS